MYQNSATTAPIEETLDSYDDRLPATMSAAFLGAVLIFASGFAQTAGFSEANILHNAAHDARHSAGFPCH